MNFFTFSSWRTMTSCSSVWIRKRWSYSIFTVGQQKEIVTGDWVAIAIAANLIILFTRNFIVPMSHKRDQRDQFLFDSGTVLAHQRMLQGQLPYQNACVSTNGVPWLHFPWCRGVISDAYWGPSFRIWAAQWRNIRANNACAMEGVSALVWQRPR